jgi:hypothetical protein
MRKAFYVAFSILTCVVPSAHAAAVVPMPEPSSVVLLGVDLLFVGSLVFFIYRRANRNGNR